VVTTISIEPTIRILNERLNGLK